MNEADTLGLIGTTIDDKYLVEEVVGEGGFALVYRATHKLWKKPVAIKCFKALSDTSPAIREELLQNFIQEGALLTELSARSTSIVQARDVGTLTTASGLWVPFMVLEWLEGETLESLLDRSPGHAWTLGETMRILEPIAMALDLAHARNIAHRDVKPANVFIVGGVLTDHMLAKLLDFGIAKVVQVAADRGFTKTGGQVTSFTPAYGAPEQFTRSHGATGPWTDVYALALIVTEMVAGKPALNGENFIELGMESADPTRRPTPRATGRDVGDDVERVMLHALAIKPVDRYQTAGEFWNELRVAIGEDPLRRNTVTDRGAGLGARGPSLSRASTDPTQAAAASKPSAAESSATTATPTSGGDGAPRSSTKTPLLVGVGALAALAAVGILFAATRGKPDGASAPTAVVAPKVASAGAIASASATVSAAPIPPPCPAGMAAIDGGRFFMGTDDGGADMKPAHNVMLSPYCIDLHEVTVADYKACSDRGDCKRAGATMSYPDMTAGEAKNYGPLCTINDPVAKAQHPINCVEWEMASTYCTSSGGRLPTEAEWEFAARGPDGRIYPWGDEAPDETRLNACGKECVAWGARVGESLKAMYPGDDGFATTAPVGSFPNGASRYGLLDVVGNVWEWVSDGFGPYTKDAQKDPQGDPKAKERVVRGGAWNGSFAAWVRPSQRYSFAPETKSHAVGFRCARSR